MKIFVTGGLGFIGSHFVRLLLREYREADIIIFDNFTYAANPANIADLSASSRLTLVKGDICNAEDVRGAIGHGADVLVNFAAETHVDRAILEPEKFLRTNVLGTQVLLDVVRDSLV